MRRWRGGIDVLLAACSYPAPAKIPTPQSADIFRGRRSAGGFSIYRALTSRTWRRSISLELAVTVADHEGLAKTAERVVIASGIPIGTPETKRLIASARQ